MRADDNRAPRYLTKSRVERVRVFGHLQGLVFRRHRGVVEIVTIQPGSIFEGSGTEKLARQRVLRALITPAELHQQRAGRLPLGYAQANQPRVRSLVGI